MNDPMSDRCAFRDECVESAVATVKTVLGPERFCQKHAAYVRMIEAEWDQAEADYYEGAS